MLANMCCKLTQYKYAAYPCRPDPSHAHSVLEAIDSNRERLQATEAGQAVMDAAEDLALAEYMAAEDTAGAGGGQGGDTGWVHTWCTGGNMSISRLQFEAPLWATYFLGMALRGTRWTEAGWTEYTVKA